MHLSRRHFLASSSASLGALSLAARLPAAEKAEDKIAFVVVGDTHYFADQENPAKMKATSTEICARLVDTINALPGSKIPAEAGGGNVAAPRGLIHAGDIIDTGDKQGRVQTEMQRTEWAAFTEDYGLDGKDGRLKCPVYEIAGNHDSPHGGGLAIEKITERNRRRAGVKNVSENGVHYSWDWNHVHFVNLGLIVGTDRSIARKRRYAALDSLAFLIEDLKEHVGDSQRPVVLTHHVDIARYTGPCDPSAPADSKEWDPCDVRAFYEAIKGYNIVAIFYGHTHARQVFRWDGTSPKAKSGIHVFNTDNASHFHGDAQAFLYCEIDSKELRVREYQTKDRWKSGSFTPQVWTSQIASRS